jgi:DNA polymerase-1
MISRLHPQLKLTRTLTGRLATSGFPVLGLPKHSEEGRRIRGLVKAPKGYVIYESDYSQIELRTAAHLSGCPALCEVYRQGGDVHANTALHVFGVPKELQDDSKHRLPAKTGNFSMLMGTTEMGLTSSIQKAGNLAWSANCPGCKSYKAPHDADCDSLTFMQGWFNTYAGVRAFMDDRRSYAEATGKAFGLWGEEWALPGAWSPHDEVKEQTLRQSHALPVQSGAQRLIKLAMKAVHARLPKDGSVEPILQIHDSLLFVVLNKFVLKWHRIVKETMEGITQWKVPIIADGKAGPSWLTLEKL